MRIKLLWTPRPSYCYFLLSIYQWESQKEYGVWFSFLVSTIVQNQYRGWIYFGLLFYQSTLSSLSCTLYWLSCSCHIFMPSLSIISKTLLLKTVSISWQGHTQATLSGRLNDRYWNPVQWLWSLLTWDTLALFGKVSKIYLYNSPGDGYNC